MTCHVHMRLRVGWCPARDCREHAVLGIPMFMVFSVPWQGWVNEVLAGEASMGSGKQAWQGILLDPVDPSVRAVDGQSPAPLKTMATHFFGT